MNQRRQKKELSIMDNVSSMSDQELRAALKELGVSPGPITDSTRSLYRKKLASLIEEQDKGSKSTTAAAIEEEEEEDTSDDDFEVQEEDLEDDYEDDYEDESEEDEEDLMSELQDDDMSSSRINNTGLTDVTRSDPDASANRISRGILLSIISFFVAILSFYLLSSNQLTLLEPLKPFKDITKRILILVALSPIGYLAYRSLRFYKLRCHEENNRVHKLVGEALELLQSPDNPRGLMPILHIRDTLLTPAERKTKKTNLLWQKAVSFIEEHESRVKVELINIDGEDFRAWKWIGTRKL